MELRHLRYFIAVAQEGHITRAAERLGMQQPPLSQQIRALERELDVQLFHRKPRGVELTDAGRAFLHDALATLARLDRGIETRRRTARGEQGRICLGVTQTSPFHPFVPRVIRAFREAYPLVSITIEEGTAATSSNICAMNGSTPRSFGRLLPIPRGLSSARCWRKSWSWHYPKDTCWLRAMAEVMRHFR